MNTEIVYTNVSATAFMPLSSLKEQGYSQARKTPLYHLVEIYCIIRFIVYFIMNGIVFVFV